jgi:hypothetical protein
MTDLLFTAFDRAFAAYPDIDTHAKLTKAELIECIQHLVPPGSPEPQDPDLIAVLRSLTTQLIAAYQADGLCQEDPFAEVWSRRIHLYESEVKNRLSNRVVLVTGGEGYIGACLIQKLVHLGVRKIISIDKARCGEGAETLSSIESGIEVVRYAADIRDYGALHQIFAIEKPAIVFHLGAQRLPWLAEIEVWETITSNIFGTQNVIKACETHQVQQCIVSSTGKASRYLTGEVYAASKKMMEWQLAIAAQKGRVTYGMVRFTHMLNNSSFCEVYDEKIKQGKAVNIHAPHRYIVGQNLTEATHLLLNALIFSEPKRLKFVLCRNLGWPVETLEVALYKILQSGQPNFIYFQGVTVGYEESFFRGQVDWRNPCEINTLINVIECQTKAIDPSGHMIIAEVPPFSEALLNHHLAHLRRMVERPDYPKAELKQALESAIFSISTSVCALAPTEVLLRILNWGMEMNHLKADGTAAIVFQGVLEMMVRGLYTSLQRESRYDTDDPALAIATQELNHLHQCFQTLGWQESPGMAAATSALYELLQALQIQQTEISPNAQGRGEWVVQPLAIAS